MPTPLHTDLAPAAIGPYSQGVAVGNMYFFSGQIPLRPDGSFVEGDITAQTRQVLANLQALLDGNNLTKDNVVKCTVFLTDLGDFPVMNDLYAAFFGNHAPARSTIQVAALPKGAKIEIEMIVAR